MLVAEAPIPTEVLAKSNVSRATLSTKQDTLDFLASQLAKLPQKKRAFMAKKGALLQ